MLLGMLVGGTMDSALRRAVIQYSNEPLEMVTRPFGIGIMIFLVIMTIFSIRTTKSTKDASKKVEKVLEENDNQ